MITKLKGSFYIDRDIFTERELRELKEEIIQVLRDDFWDFYSLVNPFCEEGITQEDIESVFEVLTKEGKMQKYIGLFNNGDNEIFIDAGRSFSKKQHLISLAFQWSNYDEWKLIYDKVKKS